MGSKPNYKLKPYFHMVQCCLTKFLTSNFKNLVGSLTVKLNV